MEQRDILDQNSARMHSLSSAYMSSKRLFGNIGTFFINEWLLFLSLAGLIATSLYLQKWPRYTSTQLIPIFLLLTLFVAVKGIERSGLLVRLSRYLEGAAMPAPKLVLLTFALSVVLSIDVTLVTMLPLVLAMRIKNRDALALLVAFSAHAGAALTPFGTPQNLFIFSFYRLETIPFIQSIAPFSMGLLLLFLAVALFLPTKPLASLPAPSTQTAVDRQQCILYLFWLGVVVLAVVHILPWYAAASVLLYALWRDRKSLAVDYPLLVTFLLFLGVANNAKTLLSSLLEHPIHLFILSSLLSQVISNVPTTLLLHTFTSQWQALLWGTNVGSFGTPVAAVANLIVWRIYKRYETPQRTNAFVWLMIWWGLVVYTIGVILYFFIHYLETG